MSFATKEVKTFRRQYRISKTLVCELYGLAQDEIAIVEEKT